MPSDEVEELLEAHEILFRRLNLYHVVPDGDGYRISSSAFSQKPSSQEDAGLSVQCARLISEGQVRTKYPREGLASITVEQVIAAGNGTLRVALTPEPDDPAHASIKPVPTGSKVEKLRKLATKLHDPDGVDEVRRIAERFAQEQRMSVNKVWNVAVVHYQEALRKSSS